MKRVAVLSTVLIVILSFLSSCTEKDELEAFDGKYLFFSRFFEGASDIYWVPTNIIEKLK